MRIRVGRPVRLGDSIHGSQSTLHNIIDDHNYYSYGYTVLNAADEEAVAAFLQGRIPFPAIPEIVGAALEAVSWSPVRDLDDVIGQLVKLVAI